MGAYGVGGFAPGRARVGTSVVEWHISMWGWGRGGGGICRWIRGERQKITEKGGGGWGGGRGQSPRGGRRERGSSRGRGGRARLGVWRRQGRLLVWESRRRGGVGGGAAAL